MTNSSPTLVKKPGPEVMFYFMLNSAELEILNAHKYKNIIIAMRPWISYQNKQAKGQTSFEQTW